MLCKRSWHGRNWHGTPHLILLRDAVVDALRVVATRAARYRPLRAFLRGCHQPEGESDAGVLAAWLRLDAQDGTTLAELTLDEGDGDDLRKLKDRKEPL